MTQVHSSFAVRTPWSSISKKVNTKSAEDAMRQANLDFEVEAVPAFHQVGLAHQEVEGHKFIRRTDSKQVLGTCGKVWQPLQNRDAFKFFQPFLDAGLARIDTVGSLDKGKKVWILAELNKRPCEIVQGDNIAKFLLLINGHDGSTSVRGGFTPIRMWCANMMPMLRESIAQGGSQIIRIRHSGDVKKNVEELQKIVNAADASFEATAEQFRYLAGRQFNEKDLERFVRIVLKTDPNTDRKDLSTRTKNQIIKIKDLIIGGLGNTLRGVRGTWYSALNGVTQYFSHERGRNDNNRMRTMMTGTGAADNERVMREAIKAADKQDGYGN